MSLEYEEPDWRDRINERVEAKQSTGFTARKSRRRASVQAFFDTPFMGALKRAAEQRDISVGSYARRALAKQIAKDLGIDWTELLAHCAAAQPYGSRAPGAKAGGWGVGRSFDDGSGHGDWGN